MSRGKEDLLEEKKDYQGWLGASSSWLNSADTLWPYAVLDLHARSSILILFLFVFQQFGKILDVEIIFNERGSKVGQSKNTHNFKVSQH